MNSKITYWEEDGGWIGYLDQYPNYWTQGDTLDDLLAHLQDLHADLSNGSDFGLMLGKELRRSFIAVSGATRD